MQWPKKHILDCVNLCVSCQLNTIQTIATWNPGRFVDFLGQGRSQCPNLDRPVLWRWKMFTQIKIHIISTISRCNNRALVPQQKKPQRKEERGGKITARPLKDFVPTLFDMVGFSETESPEDKQRELGIQWHAMDSLDNRSTLATNTWVLHFGEHVFENLWGLL